jgi:integral membrane protein (TIGR00529 family)
MVAVIKVLITLAVIVGLLNRKVKMGNAMLAGSMLLFFLTQPTLDKLLTAVSTTITSSSTWEISIALYFVMCLEYQLRTSGIINEFMCSARNIFKSERFLLVLMPAFLGFLPSLGGAIFSAPLVEDASRDYGLAAEKKAVINYWFRHIWEFTNPLFTGMLLANQLSGIPLGDLVTHMSWLTVLALLIGWVFLIAPLTPGSAAAAGSERSGASRNWRYIALATAPVLANIVLVVVFKVSAAVSMAAVVASMIVVLRQGIADIRAMLIHALDRKLLWGVFGILFFQNILRLSGVVEDVTVLLNSLAIPAAVVVSIMAFMGGILTGTSQGFVAIAFPFIALLSPGDISLVMAAFIAGTAGHMLSPAHLCMVVTLDYFKASFFKTIRPVLTLEIIMLAVSYSVIALL